MAGSVPLLRQALCHLPNPTTQLLVLLSAFLDQHAARGELTFGGCFHGGLTTDLTGTVQF